MINNRILIFACLMTMIFIPSHARVLSWSANEVPSLKLTDMEGVKHSNNAIMVASGSSIHLIRIDDIMLDEGLNFKSLFVRFQKKRISSFIRVKVFDTFTDTVLCSVDFHEQEVFDLSDKTHLVNTVYLVVELYGDDVELRSVGMEMIPLEIMEQKDLTLSSELIYAASDQLEITITLQEEAKASLLIYNRQGDVCKTFMINKVLDRGFYRFYLDPKEFSYDYSEDKRYYVWFYAENLRSKPVEFIKRFDIIP